VQEVTKEVRPVVDLDQEGDYIDPWEPGLSQGLQCGHRVGLRQRLQGGQVKLACPGINRSGLVLWHALINVRRDRLEAIVQSRQKGLDIQRSVEGRVVHGPMHGPQGAGDEGLVDIGPSSSMGDGDVAGCEALMQRRQSCRFIRRSREDRLPRRILANHVCDPSAGQDIDRRIRPPWAIAMAVQLVHRGDRTPDGSPLGQLERGLLPECRRVLARVAVPVMDEPERRPISPGAQGSAAFHQSGDGVAREQREHVRSPLVIREGVVQYPRAHSFQHFDGPAPGVFGRSQPIVLAFARLVMDRGDELVLPFDDPVGHLRTRRLQKAEHEGVSVRG